MSNTDVAVAELAVWERVGALLEQHIPSITDEDEVAMDDAYARSYLDGSFDWADVAKRTCHCGRKVADFYDYVDHLKEVFRGA